jgi:hypothetical protein
MLEIKTLSVVHMSELPNGQFFINEYGHTIDFSWGDAEYTLVHPNEVLYYVEGSMDECDEYLVELAMALREVPEGTWVAFNG